MRIQGQGRTTDGTAPSSLPIEIAFLEKHGIRPEILRRAAEVATRTGTSADAALLKEGLVPEETFYRALADELTVPFVAAVDLDPSTRYPTTFSSGSRLFEQARLPGSRSLRRAPD